MMIVAIVQQLCCRLHSQMTTDSWPCHLLCCGLTPSVCSTAETLFWASVFPPGHHGTWRSRCISFAKAVQSFTMSGSTVICLNQCSSRRGLVGDPFTCFRGILPHHMGRIGMKSGQSFLLLMLLIKAPTFSSGLIVKPAFEAGGVGVVRTGLWVHVNMWEH